METERTFRLIQIIDLRPIDFDSGKRLPLDAGDGNECDRCGREHAVVWTVEETTPGRERVWMLGPKCGPKVLDGWKPEGDELKGARKADREAARAKTIAREADRLEKLAEELGRDLPEIELVEIVNEWGKKEVQIAGTDVSIRPSLTAEEHRPGLISRLVAKEARKAGEKWSPAEIVGDIVGLGLGREKVEKQLRFLKGWK